MANVLHSHFDNIMLTTRLCATRAIWRPTGTFAFSSNKQLLVGSRSSY